MIAQPPRAMRVADIISRKGTTIITIHDYVPVSAVIDILHDQGIGALPVLNENANLVGIISERDIIDGLAEYGTRMLTMHVRDVMTTHVFTCKPDHHISDIMARMTNHRVRHLPVVVDGALRGIISIGDVVKHRLEEVNTEAGVLRDLYLATH